MPSVNPGPASSQTAATVAVITPVNTNKNPTPQGTGALRLLAFKQGANLNGLGDTAMPVLNSSAFTPTTVVVTNASISLTTASFGIFPSPAGAGTAVRANATSVANTGPTVTAANPANGASLTLKYTTDTLYLNVATAQGAPATADIYVYGYDLSSVS